ncbi:MAG: hypothetical protein IJ721_09020 [Bacteroidales bacterium]|nr:hypothetical protein [Bacteroidales bacterium]
MKKGLLISVLALTACQMVHKVADTASELFGGEVVARVGEHRLYRSELEHYIPNGVTPEDSLGLAQQYIHSWAEDLILLDMAEAQLSKGEKDVTKELEEYRRTLLKYRYEQRYINERLDTLISDEEIRTYYTGNPDKFILDRPILKARFMVIPSDSRSLKEIRKKMSSDDVQEVLEADSLAFTAAIRYVDSSDSWIDALSLAREFGTDYGSLVRSIKDRFIEMPGMDGNLRIAYVVDIVREGQPAPLEYCTDRIRDIILSTRKHALVSGLERDLLEDARNKEKFVIY